MAESSQSISLGVDDKARGKSNEQRHFIEGGTFEKLDGVGGGGGFLGEEISRLNSFFRTPDLDVLDELCDVHFDGSVENNFGIQLVVLGVGFDGV